MPLISEGHLIAWTALQASLASMDTIAWAIATVVVMRRASGYTSWDCLKQYREQLKTYRSWAKNYSLSAQTTLSSLWKTPKIHCTPVGYTLQQQVGDQESTNFLHYPQCSNIIHKGNLTPSAVAKGFWTGVGSPFHNGLRNNNFEDFGRGPDGRSPIPVISTICHVPMVWWPTSSIFPILDAYHLRQVASKDSLGRILCPLPSYATSPPHPSSGTPLMNLSYMRKWDICNWES